MKSGHVTATAVWNSDLQRVVLTDADVFHAQLRRMKFGAGESLVVRVERQEDAYTYAQLKYFHGYVLEPLVEYTGDHDWRVYLKLLFLPDDKTSLTQLTYDELRTFTERAEQWAREMCPEAYERYGKEYVA